MVRLDHASGAGSGCDYTFFDLLNKRKDGFVEGEGRKLLQEMQGTGADGHPLDSVNYCQGNFTGWFRFKGLYYYETKYKGQRPENRWEEFHIISYIKDGKINNVCSASFRVEH